MPTTLRDGINRLRATVADGRLENVRHRQNELHKLHAILCQESKPIYDAISKASSVSISDAEKEYFLAMDSIQRSYEKLDFDQSHKDEYRVKEGKSNLKRRIGAGLVAIRPAKHTRFYSIVTPLVAAIAGGNCILLELEVPHSAIDSILAKLLSDALDRDTFFICDARLHDEEIEVDLLVDQTSTDTISTSNQLLSNSNGRVLAVVDRTANIILSANALVSTRLPPYDTSPYSPDLVIVNNFVVDEFVDACFKYAESTSESSPDRDSSSLSNLRKLITDSESKGELRICASKSSPLKILVLQDRSSKLLSTKIASPYLLVLPSTSTTDTVTSQFNAPTFLATYNFATPSLCKHLSQSISSHASFANHIPLPLLHGPVSPSPATYPISIHPRYTPEMFSVPRPEIVTPLEFPSEVKDLKPTGQKKGHAVGFFEQGIFIGLGLTASVVLPLVGWGVWSLGKEGWKLAGRWR